jgi:hypothetical protein
MKKLTYPTLYLIFTIAVAGSCKSGGTIVDKDRSPTYEPISTPTRETIQPGPASATDLAIIRQYAESYQPKSGREVIPSPPVPNEKVLEAIARLADASSREHEKYIVLIFLRLSRFQVEHFKQRYELGRENPLTKEFYRLIASYGYPNAEFNPAYLADAHVEKHPELLEYSLINIEMKRIEKAAKQRSAA